MIVRFAGAARSLCCALLLIAAGKGTIYASSTVVNYRNERWGFCIAYPSVWSPYEGVNRAGVSLTSLEGATISVGAIPNQEDGADPRKRMTLGQVSASDFKEISSDPSRPVEGVRLVGRSHSIFLGVLALRTKVTYSEEVVAQTEDTIYAIRGGALYELRLKCRSVESASYEARFNLVIKSFQWSCRRPRMG